MFGHLNLFGKRRKSLSSAQSRRLLSVLQLEYRLTPAVTSFAEGVLTIDYAAVGEAIAVTNSASGITLTGATFTGAGGGEFAGVNRIEVTDSGNRGGQSLTFVGTQFSLSAGLTVAGPETLTVDADISSGGAAISLSSAGDIVANRLLETSGASLSLSAAGDITLQYALATAGGAINVVADSDVDGHGALTISSPLLEFVDPNPAPDHKFGETLAILPNGNVVIANSLGAGLVEARALLAFLPALAPAILGAELKIGSPDFREGQGIKHRFPPVLPRWRLTASTILRLHVT